VQVAARVEEVGEAVIPLVKNNFAGPCRYLYSIGELLSVDGRTEVNYLPLEPFLKLT
jgi:hypothetical protein